MKNLIVSKVNEIHITDNRCLIDIRTANEKGLVIEFTLESIKEISKYIDNIKK